MNKKGKKEIGSKSNAVHLNLVDMEVGAIKVELKKLEEGKRRQ
jgi:hypothetical protein